MYKIYHKIDVQISFLLKKIEIRLNHFLRRFFPFDTMELIATYGYCRHQLAPVLMLIVVTTIIKYSSNSHALSILSPDIMHML